MTKLKKNSAQDAPVRQPGQCEHFKYPGINCPECDTVYMAYEEARRVAAIEYKKAAVTRKQQARKAMAAKYQPHMFFEDDTDYDSPASILATLKEAADRAVENASGRFNTDEDTACTLAFMYETLVAALGNT